MLEYDADGGRLLRPTPDEWAALLDGRLAEVEGTPVLEFRPVGMFAQYAIEHGAWSTPLTNGFLELPAWHHWSHRCWLPRLLLWPAGKPDLAKRSFTMNDGLYLKVYFRPFHCFTCGAWMDAYAVDRDAYPFGELSRLYQHYHWTDAACPRCGRNMARSGLVHVAGLHETGRPRYPAADQRPAS